MVLFRANNCGSVTEEGKRTCPLADRPIMDAFRLPSSVTAPQSFLLVWRLFYSLTRLYRYYTAQVPRHLPLGGRLSRAETFLRKTSLTNSPYM